MDASGCERAQIFYANPSHIFFLILFCFVLVTLETGARSINQPINCPVKKKPTAGDLNYLEDCYLLDPNKMPFNVTECVREKGMSELCLSFGTGRGLAPEGLFACFSRYKDIINKCRNDTSQFQSQMVNFKIMKKCRFRPSLVTVNAPKPKRLSFFF